MDAIPFKETRSIHAGAPADLVHLSGVRKVYGTGIGCVHALYDIDLEIRAGDMVAVCGPCGSGKTSLLNLVGMLDTATEGLPARWAQSVREAPVHTADLRDALDQSVVSTDLTPDGTLRLVVAEGTVRRIVVRGNRKTRAATIPEWGKLSRAGRSRPTTWTTPSRPPGVNRAARASPASNCARVGVAR